MIIDRHKTPPHWVIEGLEAMVAEYRGAGDFPWTFVGTFKLSEVNDRGLNVSCVCRNRPQFSTDLIEQQMRSMTTVPLRAMTVRRPHKQEAFDIAVGQCPRCDKYLWAKLEK